MSTVILHTIHYTVRLEDGMRVDGRVHPDDGTPVREEDLGHTAEAIVVIDCAEQGIFITSEDIAKITTVCSPAPLGARLAAMVLRWRGPA